MFRKTFMTMLIVISFFSVVSAATQSFTFTVSATVPAATSVGLNVSKVNAATNVWTPVTGSILNFDPLIFNTVNGIYLPNSYYVLDIAPQGGAADNMSTTFDFVAGSIPAGQIHNIGWKTTATFVKVTGPGTNTQETGLSAHGPKKALKNLNGETILGSEIQGGWLRTYVGIVSKDPAALFPDPLDSEPFTNLDKPGIYSGTLKITATLN